jgi:hypothetical protein
MRISLYAAAFVIAATPGFAEVSPREMYEQAFSAHSVAALTPRVVSMLEQQGLAPDEAAERAAIFVEEANACHMQAMDLHAPQISNAAYDAVASGGSYADAKMAFELALADALNNGDVEVAEAFEAATIEGQACIQEAQSRLAG